MGPVKLDGWLDKAFVHPGGRLRLQLRAGQAPIMERVGPRANIPLHLRTCRICKSADAIEDAEHLVSHCKVYADLRDDCARRIEAMVAGVDAPDFKSALQNRDPALFLSDKHLMELEPELRERVDMVLCNYLKLVWRKRVPLWKDECLGGNEWTVR